ncbi:MAG: hypothetical protein KKA36_01100 [Gammaproteobacteria bacterium]|nr:hypothetical protein [Gammaproteobacteria bacterium]MBU2477659.1 hypothetical protein [Gammaproteobacteria bacterium]
MKELNNAELDCLRKIAGGYSDVISPCADNVLNRLLSLGLIEQHPKIWLPLEMMRATYHVTRIGRKYLDNESPVR